MILQLGRPMHNTDYAFVKSYALQIIVILQLSGKDK